MPKLVFSPAGHGVIRVLVEAMSSEDISYWDDDGSIGDTSTDQWPEGMHIQGMCGSPVVYDADDQEFLLRHCDVVECTQSQVDAFDPWRDEVEAWPEDMQKAASRINVLSVGIQQLRDLLGNTGFWPGEYITDTVTAALKSLLVGRAEDEIDRLEAQIDAWRKTREPVRLPDQLLEEDEDA